MLLVITETEAYKKKTIMANLSDNPENSFLFISWLLGKRRILYIYINDPYWYCFSFLQLHPAYNFPSPVTSFSIQNSKRRREETRNTKINNELRNNKEEKLDT